MKKIKIYRGFERFWHWLQALLIITLAITGFEVHGTYTLLGFERAVRLHNVSAIALIILVVFAIFWHLTTGEWKQYIPTFKKLPEMMRYYSIGIFKNDPHPAKKSELSKLNPLQRLTYLVFKVLIIPVMVTTGLVYMFYPTLAQNGWGISLGLIAFIHTLGAFVLVLFFVIHVYMTTTGHKPTTYIKAMITGWEEVEEAPEAA